MRDSQPQPGDKIAVWFSCGAASAVATKKTIEMYGDICEIIVINNTIKEEDEDNQRFLRDVEKWLGIKITFATNKDYPNCSVEEVWTKRKYMSGTKGAPCTLELKKKARHQWEIENKPTWHVLGFTKEESTRYDRFVKFERANALFVLSDTSRANCFEIINVAGIELPAIYAKGGPNANCPGCVKATSPTYWNWVRVAYPEVFASRAKQSRELGARLVRVNNKRIFLDELDPAAKGKPMKNMNIECGIFCETK